MTKTMTREEIERRVIELAAEQVGADPAGVSLATHFKQDLSYDSLDDVEFMMTIEEEFEVDVPDEVATTVRTVGDAVALVLSHRAA